MMNRIWCLLFGHKVLELQITKEHGLMTFNDSTGPILRIEACARCRLLFWKFPGADEVEESANAQKV